MKKLLFLFVLLGTTFNNAQFSIQRDRLGLKLLTEGSYNSSPNESNLATQIKLYLVGSGSNKSLSLTKTEGTMDFLFKGDSLVWNNYALEGDISGTDYSLNIWALGFGTTLKVDIIIDTKIVATKSFYINKTYITSGTFYNFTGIDPNTQKGSKVSLKIKNIGNDDAALAWDSGASSYILIPGIETNVDVKPNETTFLSEKFQLSQNYPNPFNPTTTINYSVPKQSFVTIKIYDALGREVAILVNEEKSSGNYSVNFNAAGIASGIYFYQIKTNEFMQTKKMLLLR